MTSSSSSFATGSNDDFRRPLEGCKVVEACSYISGPFCAQMLSDLGADVIRVDRPGAAAEVSGLGSADDPRTRGQRTSGGCANRASRNSSAVRRCPRAARRVF